MGSVQPAQTRQRSGRRIGKVDARLTEIINKVKWGEFRLGDLFEIQSTLSFNKERLTNGDEYDYVTRTSQNQGILQRTGFVNQENINPAGNWSLGLLQMDFFYRENPWYAGQFVRKITPKKLIAEKLNKRSIIYFSTILNKQKDRLLSVLVRDVDKVFQNIKVQLPTQNEKINFDFMENFVAELEAQRTAELEAYLSAAGLKDYTLTTEEERALEAWETGQVNFVKFAFREIFDNIKQGRRLKKDDQKPGNIPFVMAGVTNTGVVNHISNPVASFPENSITLDIFGNAFYRSYQYGAGDDTGVYWNTKNSLPKEAMLFLTAAMQKAVAGKFSYGKKLRSSQSLNIKMSLPSENGKPDYAYMQTLISAVQKQVIKDVVRYADEKIAATKTVTAR